MVQCTRIICDCGTFRWNDFQCLWYGSWYVLGSPMKDDTPPWKMRAVDPAGQMDASMMKSPNFDVQAAVHVGFPLLCASWRITAASIDLLFRPPGLNNYGAATGPHGGQPSAKTQIMLVRYAIPRRHSRAVKRLATLLFLTAMPIARRLPASTHKLRARVMAV
jgi:hypothetical protein